MWKNRDVVSQRAQRMLRIQGAQAILADGLCLQEAYESVVEYFGENPKTTSPSMFFSLFSRFTKAYKVQVSGGWGTGLCSLSPREQ